MRTSPKKTGLHNLLAKPPILIVMMVFVVNSSNRTNFSRVQVPNNHVLTQNVYYDYYYPKPRYLIIEYLDP